MSSEPTLDRFRTAMKFSLWAWAAYWPGGGILLLAGGMNDPISIVITLASLVAFVALIASGALRADSSRSMKEFLIERPLYLVAVLVVLAILAPIFAPGQNIGLRLFSTVFLAGIILSTVRLVRHLQATGQANVQSVYKSRADQSFVVFGLVGFAALMVFLDAWLPLFGTTTGSSLSLIAVVNWLNLLYPPLLLVATIPFREPLRRPKMLKAPKKQEAVEPVQA